MREYGRIRVSENPYSRIFYVVILLVVKLFKYKSWSMNDFYTQYFLLFVTNQLKIK